MAETPLDIIISVSDRNLEALDKGAIALKAIGVAQSNLEKVQDRARRSLRSLIRLHKELDVTLLEGTRRNLELLQSERRTTQARSLRAQQLRAELVATANLAAAKGNFARAETLLRRAMLRTNATSSERIRIEGRLIALNSQRIRSAQAVQNRLVQQALAEARVARASGNTARELTILNQVKRRANLTDRNRQRILLAVAAAERRARVATDRHRMAMARQRREAGRLRRAIGGLRGAFAGFVRILASAVLIGFTIRTAFRFFGALSRPIQIIARETLRATDEFRRLEVAISGITGSLISARDVMRDIRLAAAGLPITTIEAAVGIRGLAFTPATATLIQTEKGRVEALRGILSILTALATIDPEQGIRGAQFAVREALAGEFRSLRFRFEISPTVVAASIGKTLEQLKADPSLVLPALKAFVETFVGPETLAAFSDLLTTQAGLFRGVLQEFFRLVGDAGIYDRALSFLRTINQAFRRELDQAPGPGGAPTPIMTTATLISQSLERLMGVLLNSVEQLIDAVLGVRLEFDNLLEEGNLAKFGAGVAQAIDGLARWTARLSILATEMGKAFSNILVPILKFGVGEFTLEGIQARIAEIEAALALPLIDEESLRRSLGRAQAMPGVFDPEAMRLELEEEGRQRFFRLQRELRELQERLLVFAELGIADALTELENLLATAPEATKPMLQFLRLFRTGLSKLPQATDVQLIENQFLLLEQQIKNLMDDEKGIAPMMKRLDAKRQEFIGARLDLFENLEKLLDISKNDLAGLADAIQAFGTEKEIRAQIAEITETLARFTEAERLFYEEISTNITEATRGMFEAVPKGLAGRPPELILQNALSFIDSFSALMDVVGDNFEELGKINLDMAQRAQEIFERRRAELLPGLQGGQVSLIAPLLQLPADQRITAGVLPGVGGAMALRALADQIISALRQLNEVSRFAQVRRRLGLPIAEVQDFANAAKVGFDKMAVSYIEALERMIEATVRAGDDPALVNQFVLQIALVEEAVDRLAKRADPLREKFEQAAEAIVQTFRSAFTDTIVAITQGSADTIEQIFRQLAESIQRTFLDLFFQIAIESQLRRFIEGLLGIAGGAAGGAAGGGDGGGFVDTPLQSAMGHAFTSGNVVPFQAGGVAFGPTFFGMAGGKIGVMGEEQPEVILPLQRDTSGRLGVLAQGGGGTVINVNMKVVTPDANSFRQSKRQIMMDLHRIVQLAPTS